MSQSVFTLNFPNHESFVGARRKFCCSAEEKLLLRTPAKFPALGLILQTLGFTRENPKVHKCKP